MTTLTAAGQAIRPRALSAERPLTRELTALHGHARARAQEIKSGLNVGAVRAAPMAKRASLDDAPQCVEGPGMPMHAALMERVRKIQGRLKPGDIINTSPRRPATHMRAFKAISRRVQNTDFGHSAMYVGDGYVVDARNRTVLRRPLSDLLRCNAAVVTRPRVDASERQAAANWASKQVGNDAYKIALPGLISRGLKPTVMSGKHEGERQKKITRALCSSLIANAYAKVPFNEKRRIADTRPVDILHSDKVKVVGKVH